MRLLVLSLSVLALAGCQKKAETTKAADDVAPAATAGQAAAAPPARKPGLWVQTVKSGDMSQRAQVCIDAATDAKISLFGAQAGAGRCAGNRVTPAAGGGWAFESVCDMGSGGTTTTKGVATGDMASHYRLTATSTTTGAQAAQMNGAREMSLEAAWQGPCPAGMKPGDMTLDGGVTINLLTLAP